METKGRSYGEVWEHCFLIIIKDYFEHCSSCYSLRDSFITIMVGLDSYYS